MNRKTWLGAALTMAVAVVPMGAWAQRGRSGGSSAPSSHGSFSAPHMESSHTYTPPARSYTPPAYNYSSRTYSPSGGGYSPSWNGHSSSGYNNGWAGGGGTYGSTVSRRSFNGASGFSPAFTPPVATVRHGLFQYNAAGLAAARAQYVSLHPGFAPSQPVIIAHQGFSPGSPIVPFEYTSGYYYGYYPYSGDYAGDDGTDYGFNYDADMGDDAPDSMGGDMTGVQPEAVTPEVYHISGRVTSLDSGQMTIQASNGGYSFLLSSTTHTSKILSVGDQVTVTFSVGGDGSYQALDITR